MKKKDKCPLTSEEKRRARQAEALRANLQRRKEQARQREDSGQVDPDVADNASKALDCGESSGH
ncbi:MAG: hypothetical protein VX700_10635 [Pseudomonadota bacterium]|nr:hypothetical protein [Pseudomonadota bacterium]